VSEFCHHYATFWEAIADEFPNRFALQHGPRQVSWGAFEQRSARLAGALQSWGLGHGDTVAAYLYNCPEYLEIFFGALKLRAVPANINYRYTSNELLALLANSEAKMLFFDTALRDRVASIADRTTGLGLVEVGGRDQGRDQAPIPGAHSYEEVLAAARPAARIWRDEDDVFLSYTGGTTGLPKGVLTRVGLMAQYSYWFRDMFFGERDTFSPLDYVAQLVAEGVDASVVPASPLMHGTGLAFASLPALSSGGLVNLLPSRSFDAHELLDTVAAAEVQVVSIVGDAFALPILRAIDAGRPGGGRYDVGSVRVICSAGVAWTAQVKARLLAHMPDALLVDVCGATEGMAYGFSQVRRGDSVSTANFMAAEGLKALAPDGTQLPRGEIGMLAAPTSAAGYHRDPKATESAFRMIDGVLHAMPGDLGRIETDGTVTLIGRGVATINTGGEKVFPTEVEEAMRTHPGVEDSVVLGVPDPRFGQVVAALVVAAPGSVVDIGDLRDTVRNSLAGYKIPRRIVLVHELPRMPNGKIDYPAAIEVATARSPKSTPKDTVR
jgi:acyl-CoA synthetase (AMP-forming)/AMP-acid ligase II